MHPRCRPLVALSLVAVAALDLASARAAHDPVGGRHGMVASTSEIASRVGVSILEKGGNAIDAAVAVGLALAVTWPSAGNLGGGGFMLIRRADGTAVVIDYRERAPRAATPTMYLDSKGNVIPGASTVGHRAVGVPGTVAGLGVAWSKQGRLAWADLVRPARELAEKGFPLNLATINSLNFFAPHLSKFPESKRIFLRDGKPYEVGDVFVQPELAATLARIEKDGYREFYTDETSRRLVAEMKAGGGLITARDLAEYQPTLREPLRGHYRGHEILTMPPPSSGGAVLLEMLHMLEGYAVGKLGFGSADHLHLLVEVMRRAFADRAAYMGDTDFVKVPLKGLLSKKYAQSLARTIDPARATPSEKVRAGEPTAYEAQETTHFTVVDAEGNVVTNTYTLNGGYGSGVTARGTGVLLNNEMDDFTSKPGVPNQFGLLQGAANAIAPGKRPLSAMTPTIVLQGGKPLLAIGSPGGPTIINTVLQVIVNVLDFGMNVREAIDAPRIHHQWMPDAIMHEPYGVSRDVKEALEKRGHRWSDRVMYIGDAEGVMIDPKANLRLGASDPRQGGVPVGY